ncbi:hypothetical protein SNEBB_011333 [Seison nebaliae]|nr:hypothetical protein SNEBB_011333 [Seison nebaliae]
MTKLKHFCWKLFIFNEYHYCSLCRQRFDRLNLPKLLSHLQKNHSQNAKYHFYLKKWNKYKEEAKLRKETRMKIKREIGKRETINFVDKKSDNNYLVEYHTPNIKEENFIVDNLTGTNCDQILYTPKIEIAAPINNPMTALDQNSNSLNSFQNDYSEMNIPSMISNNYSVNDISNENENVKVDKQIIIIGSFKYFIYSNYHSSQILYILLIENDSFIRKLLTGRLTIINEKSENKTVEKANQIEIRENPIYWKYVNEIGKLIPTESKSSSDNLKENCWENYYLQFYNKLTNIFSDDDLFKLKQVEDENETTLDICKYIYLNSTDEESRENILNILYEMNKSIRDETEQQLFNSFINYLTDSRDYSHFQLISKTFKKIINIHFSRFTPILKNYQLLINRNFNIFSN